MRLMIREEACAGGRYVSLPCLDVSIDSLGDISEAA